MYFEEQIWFILFSDFKMPIDFNNIFLQIPIIQIY